jgi:enoyl-CoA hydratase/carnithine racemase
MTAAEGDAWGFFNRLVPPEQLQDEALRLAQEIATGPTRAHAMTKRMLHAEWHLSIDAAIEAEAEAQAQCMQSEDFHRAYRAFVAKQKPQFEGN